MKRAGRRRKYNNVLFDGHDTCHEFEGVFMNVYDCCHKCHLVNMSFIMQSCMYAKSGMTDYVVLVNVKLS